MFKKGQQVWCVIFGEGVVSRLVDGPFSVVVEFLNGEEEPYTSTGHFFRRVRNQSLFPYPVKIVQDESVVTKPSIDWSHVSPEYNYLAQDSSGQGYLCGKKPQRMDYAWDMRPSPYIRATTFTSYVPGTCDWKDSLVKRPN